MDVKTFCLGILSFGDATGYEIKKKLESSFGHFYDASFGSIYPALRKLTEDELVERQEQAQDKRPDKKIYSITTKGRLALLDELAKPVSDDRIRSDFLATMLFSDILSPALVDQLITERIESYRQALELLDLDDQILNPGGRFVCGFGKAIYGSAIQYLESHRHEIVGEKLIAEAETV